jgi:hypothetical protein
MNDDELPAIQVDVHEEADARAQAGFPARSGPISFLRRIILQPISSRNGSRSYST